MCQTEPHPLTNTLIGSTNEVPYNKLMMRTREINVNSHCDGDSNAASSRAVDSCSRRTRITASDSSHSRDSCNPQQRNSTTKFQRSNCSASLTWKVVNVSGRPVEAACHHRESKRQSIGIRLRETGQIVPAGQRQVESAGESPQIACWPEKHEQSLIRCEELAVEGDGLAQSVFPAAKQRTINQMNYSQPIQ
jgi:hypothetical protein